VADEEIVALLLVRHMGGVTRCGAAHMGLARGVEIRLITFSTADGAFDD
jgi:hypothetical protein